MDRGRDHDRGHHRPAVHRLPGRVRDLQRRHPSPAYRRGGAQPARADAALQSGAARPAARRPGGAAGRDRARQSPEVLLHQQRHRRRRRGDEAGPPLHREIGLHLDPARLPRKVLRIAVADGQGRVPHRLRAAPAGRLFRRVRRRRRGRVAAQEGARRGSGHCRGGGRAGAGRGGRPRCC